MEFLSSALYALKPRFDDDIVDRFNYYYSSSLFLIFAIFVSAKQWVGQPIECWVPAFFKGAWEEYAEDYCFVQNTYWLSLTDPIPEEYNERDRRQLGYYQWVPIILAAQALFFYIPYLVWTVFSWQTGVDIHNIVYECRKVSKEDPEDEGGDLRTIASLVRETIHASRMSGRPCIGCISPGTWGQHGEGYYMTALNIFVKLLYLINCFLQLAFMNWALRTGSSPYGYTIQCVLLINLFNEKIFLILWCWVWLGIALNLANLLYWLSAVCFEGERVKNIMPYLQCQQSTQTKSLDDYQQKYTFISHYLQADGVLLFQKIKHHAGTTTAAKIAAYIFEDYRAKGLDALFHSPKLFTTNRSPKRRSIESGSYESRDNEESDQLGWQIRKREQIKNRRLI